MQYFLLFISICVKLLQVPASKQTWWNWYTRTLEVRMPYGVEVRVLSSAQLKHKNRF